MKKQVLLLSVALSALAASPAFADDWTDITTDLNVPINTAAANNGAPGDIKIEDSGSVTVALAGAAVTINSDNGFLSEVGSTISNKNTADAIGMLIDLTTTNRTSCAGGGDCLSGITMASAIDLSGSGDTKRGVWFQGPVDDTTGGPFAYTGNVDMSDGTVTVTGDSSVGVLIDSLAELNGNLTLGQINMKPSSDSSTAGVIGFELDGTVNGDILQTNSMNVTGTASSSPGGLIGMWITGTVNGNVTIDDTAAINAVGSGARGVLITGTINACNLAVFPECDQATDSGSFINKGTIQSRGGAVKGITDNPIGSSALAFANNVEGGILNGGPSFDGDTVPHAVISTSGGAPALNLTPTLQTGTPTSMTVGVYAADLTDPGFSIYNRGSITSSSPNVNQTAQAIFIGGTSTATVTLTGGLFNSGNIGASAASGDGGISVSAIALNIGDYAIIGPDDQYEWNNDTEQFEYLGHKQNLGDLHDEQASIVNSSAVGSGAISASIAGPMGGEADAILITANATVPSIINSGTISAVATTTDSTITALRATAIWDRSGTLSYIQNNGTITAAASTLDNDGQIARAIDLSADTESSYAGQHGVLILNQATIDTSAHINGDIVFGTGDHQVIDVEGVSTTNVATIDGNIFYGGGSTPGSDELIIGTFATVTGKILANETVGVNVEVNNEGTLNLLNDKQALNAHDFTVSTGGTLNLTLLQEFRSGIIAASDKVFFDTGADLNLTYGSFVPSDSTFVLITAPHADSFANLVITDLSAYQQQIDASLPFLFETADLRRQTTTDGTTDELVLEVDPKDAAQLGLTGYAAQILPFANQALANDDVLGAAFVNGIKDQKTAQLAYNEMAPDVSGGARAIAIALTDQSSGPVAARQRMLRMYGKETGEVTLWGEEFAEFVQDPGDRSTGQTGFKDHGFGFVMGMDGGDPKTGWYGGAFTFYSGDIVEPLPRDSHTNTLWYMLTGYTDWRGRGLFLDTKVDIGYMDLKSKRFIDLTLPNPNGSGTFRFQDEADSKRPGVVGALGLTTGAILAYGSTTFTPQISIDGMTMRQEGYTETHPGTATTGNGKGMNLQTQSFYASSARIFIGTEVREDLNFGDFFVQPDLRIGYRYDFLNDATKLKVNFADIGTNTQVTPGQIFTVIGPDPAQGNFVAGASIAATTDAWTLGANFDFVRGTNGATTEVGIIHLLGRI